MATANLAKEAGGAKTYKMEHVSELTLTDLIKHISAVVANGEFALPANHDSWEQIIRNISGYPEAPKFIRGIKSREEISEVLTNLRINQYFESLPPSFSFYSVSKGMADHQIRSLEQYSDDYRAFVLRSARMIEVKFALRRR